MPDDDAHRDRGLREIQVSIVVNSTIEADSGIECNTNG